MILIPEIKLVYPIILLLSFIIPFILIYLRNKNKIKKEVLLDSFLTAFICSMSGGMLYHMIAEYITNKEFKFGLSAYGGAIGLILSVFLYNKLFLNGRPYRVSNKVKNTLKSEYFVHIPLIYAIGKLACGFNGCCLGYASTGRISITYDNIISYFPVQFVETIVFFLIYLIGITVLKENKNKVLIIFILSAAAKACLECLRYGYTGFNINQVVSFIIIAVCTTLILTKRKPSKKKV